MSAPSLESNVSAVRLAGRQRREKIMRSALSVAGSVLIALTVTAGCGDGASVAAAPGAGASAPPSSSPAGDPPSMTGNPVLAWNVVALRTVAPYDPPREARALAIVHVAIADALSGLHGRWAPLVEPSGAASSAGVIGEGTDAAAVAQAARDTLVALYPDKRADLDAAFARSIGGLPSGAAQETGRSAGRRAADAVLAWRAHDHAEDQVTVADDTTPGHWRATPPALAAALDPGWGQLTPFVLRRGDRFRPPAPPSMTSEVYTRDFREIVEIGAASSTVRTPDQTAAAQFWKATATQEWNTLARGLVTAEHLSVPDTARLFAQLNLGEADAAIAAWDAKFTYRQWRPITGIREAAADGNAATTEVADWTPLIPTPPFPDYVCGHSALGGAAEGILGRWFGAGPRSDLDLTSPAAPGLTRHYATFAAIGDEVLNARVWGGVHWRSSCEQGRELGGQVASFVLAHSLRPVGGSSDA
ncbi:MAG TPA: vanadium-dependent haloperoxidase [Sporichthya sp.]|nr:vanadium-dependent haloperoxidase [Sporichthya sp.]